MARFFLVLFLYISALFSVYAGFQLAPDMKWPHTDIEWVAANLLVIGMSLKMLGHIILLNIR
jgi:hypothetical protein